jgi:hypothetical protein
VDSIPLKADGYQVDGRLDDNSIVFFQKPTPETSAAWDELSTNQYVVLTTEELLEMGNDPSTALRVPDEYSNGTDAYIASVAVLHRLHCLNFLRQGVYFDYYFGNLFPGGNLNHEHQGHVNHCLEVLRQDLICRASTDIIPFAWYDNDEKAVDYSLNRKCGNIDGIRDWAATRAISFNPFDVERPKDQQTAQSKMFGRIGSQR